MSGPYDERRPRSRLLALASLATLFLVAALAVVSFKPDLSPALDALRARLNPDLRRNTDEPEGDKYLIGVGKGDITGPSVEITFGGYADLEQAGSGIRQRLYSRAFIVGSVDEPKDRFVYIVLDNLAGDTAIRNGVLEGLRALGDEYAAYTTSNLALTGTHTHAGPGAWMNYLLPTITSLGFSKQSYQAIVDGTILSIKRAHESLVEVGTPTTVPCC